MRILFVSSGNIKKFGISPIIINQGESLREFGLEIIYYGIKGKGFYNYFLNLFTLRRFIKEKKPDLIHAHYSFTAFITTIVKGKRPMIVSLMGSDCKSSKYYLLIINLLNSFFWEKVIIKSESMRQSLKGNNIEVVPNGVNFKRFKPMDKGECRRILGLDTSKKYIAFIADPSRKEKNYALAKESVQKMDNSECELLVVFGEKGIDHDLIPIYINASDALILTSLEEGSPNVVKEAMACNCPVVSTDVGDVRSVIGDTPGCYIVPFDSKIIAEKLKLAIEYKETNGRENIKQLNQEVIASRLIDIYNQSIIHY